MRKDFEIDLDYCISCIKSGQIFLYPTDTVWGIGADATNEAAAQRIMELKRRPAKKSFVILVANLQQLSRYVRHFDTAILPYLTNIKKPTTVIYPGAIGLAPTVMAQDGTVAIRICEDPFCQSLLLQSDKPLLSTSANLSGAPTPGIYKEIHPAIIQGVDYVVKYRQEDTRYREPSTIIKYEPSGHRSVQGQSPIKIIRP